MEDGRDTAEKIIPITIVSKDDGPVYASPHDVVQGASSIYASLSGHVLMIGTKLKN